MIIEIFQWLCRIILAVSGIYGLYQVYISLHMFGTARLPQPKSNKIHRFAILICAKDEERVIGQLLSSLKKQNYPKDSFDIFVTADNCTDQTAAVARAAGATVLERFDSKHKSKGYALNWFFAIFLREYDGRYDACAIFDADNLVDKEYLAAMNRQLNAGNLIAAGYRIGKNPTSSWIAGCSSIFWLLQTRAFYIPRSRLNLPCCSVGGTGFMFDLTVLGEKGWSTSSICEDIEFTLNSIADGYYIAFAPDAQFYDEQPITFAQSLKQRYRWSVGSLQTLSICSPKLFRAFRSGKSRVFDALWYSFGIVVTGTTGLAWTALLFLDAAAANNWTGLPVTIGLATASGFVAISFLAWLILILEKRSWPGAWKAILSFPIYLVSWSVINIIVLFYRNSVWRDMPHVESLSIEEFDKK